MYFICVYVSMDMYNVYVCTCVCVRMCACMHVYVYCIRVCMHFVNVHDLRVEARRQFEEVSSLIPYVGPGPAASAHGDCWLCPCAAPRLLFSGSGFFPLISATVGCVWLANEEGPPRERAIQRLGGGGTSGDSSSKGGLCFCG